MASESLTAGEGLWDERSPEEPEGALLCERPALVLPLPHEEQIHRHGLTVPSSQNTALEESQSTHREVKTLVTKKNYRANSYFCKCQLDLFPSVYIFDALLLVSIP